MKFGLIGHPISHSLSPRLFEAAYAGRYSYDLIDEADFARAMETFLREYDGVNVTAPFKQEAYLSADMHDSSASRVRAANLLKKDARGQVTAYNTDYLGVKMILQDHFELEESGNEDNIKALVIGCGGAGKAAACAAADLGMETTVVNRTLQKAEDFVSLEGNSQMKAAPVSDVCRLIEENNLIIYTVPETIEQIKYISRRTFRGKSILEAGYASPCFARRQRRPVADIMTMHKDRITIPQRCYYISGELWLLAQAICGYSIFTGEAPDETAMLSSIRR